MKGIVTILALSLAVRGTCQHVVLVSIDGLRPEFYLDRSWPVPNLRGLMKEGVYADHMKSVFPAYTYPAHTAMLTGALPARSGIYFNQPRGSKGEWNWFTSAIKVPTIWQRLRKNKLTSGAVQWPVSVERRTDANITYNVPEIWDPKHPSDRITETRKYATTGLIAEIEQNETGALDSLNMSEVHFSLDINAAKMAGYIFKKYKPSLLAIHFALVDGMEHVHGREHDSVRLAVANVDDAIGIVLKAIEESGVKESTTVLIVGDHGFSDIHTVLRPNLLLNDVPAKFTAAGGSAFLYTTQPSRKGDTGSKGGVSNVKTIAEVKRKLDALPKDMRKLFRIIERTELDRMGVDSSALIALAAIPGIVFSGALPNTGPGTTISQNNALSFMGTTKGGHHGYDPNLPEMYTGFIASGAGVQKGKRIKELCVTDIAPLVAELLGIVFECPDGKLVKGILKN